MCDAVPDGRGSTRELPRGSGCEDGRSTKFVHSRGSHHAIHTAVVHRSPRGGGAPQNLPRAGRRRPRRRRSRSPPPPAARAAPTRAAESAPPPRPRGDGKIKIPDDIKDRLKEHGIDLDKWRNGAWKNWDKDDWLREAEDFVNPIIEDLWDPDRMRDAEEPPDKGVDENDISGDQGVTDPTPEPVQARRP